MKTQLSLETTRSAWLQAACFLAIIFCVPAAQTAIELAEGERLQSLDVLRRAPAEKNLRTFERTLEERSRLREVLRPAMQRVLFAVLGDAGPDIVLGREQWAFYRPGIRYLVEADREAEARKGVLEAIVRFRDRLAERGVSLLVVPVPTKASVLPDMISRRARGCAFAARSPTLALLADLEEAGVATVDLFSLFQGDEVVRRELYLARDTHWTPRGVRLAAREAARKLRELDWAPPAAREHTETPVKVRRFGDILEMGCIPEVREAFQPQDVACFQVRDRRTGLILPAASEHPGALRDPAREARLLLLGDSYSRIYQLGEPRSLGEVLDPQPAADGSLTAEKKGAPARRSSRRFLPGSAGLVAHLARELHAPVDAIISDGGASTDVRRKLAVHPAIFEGKKVVVWEFTERDVRLGRKGWEDVPLPAEIEDF